MLRVAHFELRGATARPLGIAEGGSVRAVAGRVWITVEGCLADVWLNAGDEWCARKAACLWMSADPTATIQVREPVHDAPRRFAPKTMQPRLVARSLRPWWSARVRLPA